MAAGIDDRDGDAPAVRRGFGNRRFAHRLGAFEGELLGVAESGHLPFLPDRPLCPTHEPG